VDKLSFLPMVQIVYDDKGLYSRIEYSSFVMNPAFTEEDFSKKNKKYGF
jgi:outer membrane lipoprotein-sorting protein